MQETIKGGAILIKEGTLMPETLRLESEPCVSGWRFVKDFDGYRLEREIHKAGWTFFCLVGEASATVFGMDREKMVRRAIERILANAASEKFNSLEIVRMASVASKRFLGVRYVTVSGRSRHIQKSPYLVPNTNVKLRQRELAATV